MEQVLSGGTVEQVLSGATVEQVLSGSAVRNVLSDRYRFWAHVAGLDLHAEVVLSNHTPEQRMHH